MRLYFTVLQYANIERALKQVASLVYHRTSKL